MANTDYRMELNNYLQSAFRNQTTLTWDTEQLGPEHRGLWKATALINHVGYGTGTAAQLNDAKEAAAYQALLNLRGQQ